VYKDNDLPYCLDASEAGGRRTKTRFIVSVVRDDAIALRASRNINSELQINKMYCVDWTEAVCKTT
jgi:hypothetical protein